MRDKRTSKQPLVHLRGETAVLAASLRSGSDCVRISPSPRKASGKSSALISEENVSMEPKSGTKTRGGRLSSSKKAQPLLEDESPQSMGPFMSSVKE